MKLLLTACVVLLLSPVAQAGGYIEMNGKKHVLKDSPESAAPPAKQADASPRTPMGSYFPTQPSAPAPSAGATIPGAAGVEKMLTEGMKQVEALTKQRQEHQKELDKLEREM